jgi:predicted DNA-binding transcriptional regulator AlpA
MDLKLFLSDKDLAARYGVTRATIWRWRAEGTLPEPVRVSSNTTRWRKADIEEHDKQLELATRATKTAQAAQ